MHTVKKFVFLPFEVVPISYVRCYPLLSALFAIVGVVSKMVVGDCDVTVEFGVTVNNSSVVQNIVYDSEHFW
jgi:hypothetical protein